MWIRLNTFRVAGFLFLVTFPIASILQSRRIGYVAFILFLITLVAAARGLYLAYKSDQRKKAKMSK
jgi:uncharacterized membrane protein